MQFTFALIGFDGVVPILKKLFNGWFLYILFKLFKLIYFFSIYFIGGFFYALSIKFKAEFDEPIPPIFSTDLYISSNIFYSSFKSLKLKPTYFSDDYLYIPGLLLSLIKILLGDFKILHKLFFR